MPDILHWLGITKIDRMLSMSNMKHDAIVEQGIPIIERVPIPDDMIPEDSRVEIDAKIHSGYFTTGKIMTMEELANVQGRAWEDIDVSQDLGKAIISRLTVLLLALITSKGSDSAFGGEFRLVSAIRSCNLIPISASLRAIKRCTDLAIPSNFLASSDKELHRLFDLTIESDST